MRSEFHRLRSRWLVASAHEGTSLVTLTALETSDFTRNIVTTEGRIKGRAAFTWLRSLIEAVSRGNSRAGRVQLTNFARLGSKGGSCHPSASSLGAFPFPLPDPVFCDPR